MNTDELSYTILAMAPFVPTGGPSKIEIHDVNVDTIDSVIASLSPKLWISLPQAICPEGGITVAPKRMKDLTPDGIIDCVPYLKDLFDAKEFIKASDASGASPEETASLVRKNWPDLHLDLTLPETQKEKCSGGSAIDDILSMVAMPGGGSASDDKKAVVLWLNEIDGRIRTIMGHVFSDNQWRIFESAWRGLEVFFKKGQKRREKKVEMRIVPVSYDTLSSAIDVISERLDGKLPGLIIIDVPFDQTPRSQELLERIASFASTMLVPTAVWITPGFLGIPKWDELHKLPYLKTHIDGGFFAKWHKLRESPDGNWLAALAGRFLVRPSYGKDLGAKKVFFEETAPLWVSPVWALAALVAQSIEKFGWPSRFTDYMTIRLSDLAVFYEPGGSAYSTETLFSDDRIRQFAEIGITALCGVSKQDTAFFPRGAVASGESLPFQLLFSRIIGYLVRMREHAPKYTDDSPTASDYVRHALERLFKDAGSGLPRDIDVTEGEPGENGLAPIRIVFTMSEDILPVARKVEFTFLW